MTIGCDHEQIVFVRRLVEVRIIAARKLRSPLGRAPKTTAPPPGGSLS